VLREGAERRERGGRRGATGGTQSEAPSQEKVQGARLSVMTHLSTRRKTIHSTGVKGRNGRARDSSSVALDARLTMTWNVSAYSEPATRLGLVESTCGVSTVTASDRSGNGLAGGGPGASRARCI
jgi:hypothetical protein